MNKLAITILPLALGAAIAMTIPGLKPVSAGVVALVVLIMALLLKDV